MDVLESAAAKNYALLTFYEGLIGNTEVVAIFCGVCKVNAAIATQILIDRFEVDCVIVSGTAGGLDKRLQIWGYSDCSQGGLS